MKFKYYGSNPMPHFAMGALFIEGQATEVTDPAAIGWLSGHPEYVAVPDEPEVVEEPVAAPAKPKKARKAKK